MDFSKVIELCQKRIDGEITVNEFINELSNIKIKSYINLGDKNSIIRKAFVIHHLEINNDTDFIDFATNLELIYLFDFLFSYTDIKNVKRSISNFDIICRSELNKYILTFCEYDYNKMVKLFQEMTNISDFIVVKNVLESISVDKTEILIKRLSEVLKDKKLVTDLKDIIKFNNPFMDNVVELNKEVSRKRR